MNSDKGGKTSVGIGESHQTKEAAEKFKAFLEANKDRVRIV